MTENENAANFCFQGHDKYMEHSEFNINKYVGTVILFGEEKY